ncbi:MAG TPA: hypothetical protein VMN37_10580 [Gemmatimonadales bacterium]|nr:hypothetical protein [Gemmatimonadales bacterium]
MSTPALRRADWRFLLPGAESGVFEHLVVIGGPEFLAECLRDAGAARQVSRGTSPAADADAVAVLADARVQPEAAAAGLAPGGALYVEVDRRRPGRRLLTPARMERRLRRVGLTVTARHWVIPEITQARRYLPLDAPRALDWFLTTLQPAKSLAADLVVRGLQGLAAGDTARIAPWVPCYGITAVRGEPRLPALLEREELPGGRMALGTRTALITSGEDDGSRVVLLPFPERARAPEIALKAARIERFNAHTEWEQALLRQLREQLEPALRGSLPEPLGCFRHGRSVVGMESVAPGRAMTVTSGRWGTPHAVAVEDLRAATEWLSAFHAQAAVGWCWSAERAAALVRRIDAYGARFAPPLQVRQLLDLAGARAGELTGRPLPLVWVHNDYGPWNIYRHGGRLTVIDWEFGGEDETGRHGPALTDLIYFVTAWSTRVWRLSPPGGEPTAVRRLFAAGEPGDDIARAAQAALHDYMRRLAIDPRFLPLLLVYTWVERALDRHDRQGPSGRNPYVDHLAALAPASERLFR